LKINGADLTRAVKTYSYVTSSLTLGKRFITNQHSWPI